MRMKVSVDERRQDEQPYQTTDTVMHSIYLAHPMEIVTVGGLVTGLRPTPKDKPESVYGDLEGASTKIQFCCPYGNAPRCVGENALIRGTIKAQPSRFHSGMDVTIFGDYLGEWKPETTPSYDLSRNHRQPLKNFLRTHGLESLAVLASYVGRSDCQTAVNRAGVDVDVCFYKCNFKDQQTILEAVDHAIEEGRTRAVAFVRGGGESKGLSLWDDPEFVDKLIKKDISFYTAVGHSDSITLADKASDESFTTPTDIGNAIGSALSELRQEDESRQSLRLKSEKIAQLEKEQEEAHISTREQVAQLESNQRKAEINLRETIAQLKTSRTKLIKRGAIALGVLGLLCLLFAIGSDSVLKTLASGFMHLFNLE